MKTHNTIMLESLIAGLLLTLFSAPVTAKEAYGKEIEYVCRGDQVTSTAGYRTGFREKNRLKRLVFLLEKPRLITVREGDGPSAAFANYQTRDDYVVSDLKSQTTFRLNLANLRFVATSPGGYLADRSNRKPWLVAGKCRAL
ncbi:hypothetical protein [Marinobacter sediminum]|uniref:hypothetical protein n=1 Tax=Marinobacter sediminum TaxID=256323 RepID=UPI0035658DBF